MVYTKNLEPILQTQIQQCVIVMLGKLLLRRLFFVAFLCLVFVCIQLLKNIKPPLEIMVKHQTAAKPPTQSIISKLPTEITIEETTFLPVLAPPPALAITTSEWRQQHDLPWFFRDGTGKAVPHKADEKPHIWPEDKKNSDRVVDQLMYVPLGYNEATALMKTIVLWHGLNRWIKYGQASLLEDKCPVNRCTVTDEHSQAAAADAILFKDHFVLPNFKRPAHQVWIIYLLENPYHTERLQYNDLINWTATYRRDSDIVTPYERWVYYDQKLKNELPFPRRNFAMNKTHQVAWFVSNCNAHNGRLSYANELQKHIPVDIYGFCGPLKCPRTNECFHLLDIKYKFYLAFENSNCVDYVTEKFFANSLQRDVLPIVMGARPENYVAMAPHHSYIHVDDFASPKELAEYLLKLDNDDDLYNSYFRWKGTGEFINTYFFCRLCAMLHSPVAPRNYRNLNKWWKNVDTCTTSQSWRRKNRIKYTRQGF